MQSMAAVPASTRSLEIEEHGGSEAGDSRSSNRRRRGSYADSEEESEGEVRGNESAHCGVRSTATGQNGRSFQWSTAHTRFGISQAGFDI